MEKKQQVVIILPEQLADLPVKIIRSATCKELVFSIQSPDEEVLYGNRSNPKYAFVWQRENYAKVEIEDIQWIEADKSYSVIHLVGGRSMTVSFNLAAVTKDLPKDDFMRIHRSYVINMRHVVESLTGNCLKIGNKLFVILSVKPISPLLGSLQNLPQAKL